MPIILGRRALTRALAVGLLLSAGTMISVAAGALEVPIPGLKGATVQVAGALRTDDGGAILAASLAPTDRAPGSRLVLARLQADGALNLGYGTEGLSSPLAATARPTALAVNPSSTEAWVGISTAAGGKVIAVNRVGGLESAFGARGVLRLPAQDGSPVALTWAEHELLVAAGTSPCRGCRLSMRNPSSGTLLAHNALTPDQLIGAGCGKPQVTAAAFATDHRLYVSISSPRCGSAVIVLSERLRPLSTSLPVQPAIAFRYADASTLTGAGHSICFGAASASAVALVPLASPSPPAALFPPAPVVAVAPLGPGACAALIATHGATVAQMSMGERRATTDRMPASLVPLAMFRCNQHLLVVASTGRGGQQSTVIVPVLVRRGPFAGVHTASVNASTTGCT